jgi:hypothetical protein
VWRLNMDKDSFDLRLRVLSEPMDAGQEPATDTLNPPSVEVPFKATSTLECAKRPILCVKRLLLPYVNPSYARPRIKVSILCAAFFTLDSLESGTPGLGYLAIFAEQGTYKK